MGILKEAGKTVTEFPGIMANPTYKKSSKAQGWPGIIRPI